MSTVELKNDQLTVVIQKLVIEDQRVHRMLSMQPTETVEQKIRDAITIGFLTFDRTTKISDVDWVSQRLQEHLLMMNFRLEQQAQSFAESVKNHFDPSKAGSLLSPINELVHRTKQDLTQRLTSAIDQMRTHEDQMSRVINSTFDVDSRSSRIQVFSNQMAETIERLENSIDPNREGTIFRDFLGKFEEASKAASASPLIQSRIDGLRDEIREMVAQFKATLDGQRAVDGVREAMTNSSPAKGMVFEDAVKEELKCIAEVRNDLVEIVGTSTGKGTSKKGDLVYYVSTIKSRIVFELKDYSSKFTFQKIRDLMADSISNRDSLYGVFLVKDESCLPEGVGRFFISDDFCIATQEFLEIATKIAIMISHQKINRMTQSKDGPDWLSIESNLSDIKEITEDLSAMESSCATAERAIIKTADGIRRVSKVLSEKVEMLLAQVLLKDGGTNDAL